MKTNKEAYELGYEHGAEMARESGSADAGPDGWDGLLINADAGFVEREFGWRGQDSSQAARDRLAAYCRGAQAGADAAVAEIDE